MSHCIKIVSVPPGEAPQYVREAWVGLVMPLADGKFDRMGDWKVFGVLSGPKTSFGRWLGKRFSKFDTSKGYVVEARKAVDILQQVNPNAARWWIENAPHVLEPGRGFCFDAESCEEVPFESESWK